MQQLSIEYLQLYGLLITNQGVRLNSGHYYTIAREYNDFNWTIFDDTTISSLQGENVLEE